MQENQILMVAKLSFLKILWITGSSVLQQDPALLSSPFHVKNVALYNERAPCQFAGFARSASGALHDCGPISSFDQSPFRVRRQQDH